VFGSEGTLRIAIINLFYPPDLAPTAHMAAGLAEHRAAIGDRVTVVAGTGAYLGGSDRPRAGRPDGEGPRVIRLWTPGLGKASTARRMGDYVTFLISAVARLVFLPRQDVVIALTSPPFVLVAAVAHGLLHPRTRVILWSHDVYPDAAETFGTIRRKGTISRALRALNRWLLRRVDHVVAMDRAMLGRILSSLPADPRPPVSVIPTWEPVLLFPQDGRPERWMGYADADLAGRFVVLHLGNLGFGHRTDTIAEAAAALADEDVTFLFVGGGERYPELADEAARRRIDNVRFHGYVPKEQTPAVLAGAGCALISMDDRSIGIQSPCKMNGSLAMGVPVLYAGPTGTNVDDAITEYACGFSLRQGDVAGLVDAIRRLRSHPDLAAALSKNARRAFEETYSDRSALPRFDSLLDDLTASGGGAPAG
jgi:colanic acid biosynthesis glycosyl transferase WcaI